MRIIKEISCGIVLCFFISTVAFLAASCLAMTAISINRFLAIYLRVRYRVVVSMRRTVAVVVLLWIWTGIVVASTQSGLTNAFQHVFSTVMVFMILVVFIVTSFAFFMSVRILLQSQAQIHIQQEQQVFGAFQQHCSFNLGRYKRSVYSMLYVYGLFVVCYLPMTCFFMFSLSNPDLSLEVIVFNEIALPICFLSLSVNPFLCCYRMRDLRRAVMSIWSTRQTALTLQNNRE